MKCASDGESVGDCPFSQRVWMVAILKIPTEQFRIISVELSNKPESFIKMNSDGKVPVLQDHLKNQTISDSGKIVEYIDSVFPDPDMKVGYSGPAREATDAVFGKLASMLKNSCPGETEKLKSALITELSKFNEYVQNVNHTFLLGDRLYDIDCSVLPKMRHVQVAGKHFRGFDIPEQFSTLFSYIKRGEATDVFTQTCPKDREIIHGWSQHGIEPIVSTK